MKVLSLFDYSGIWSKPYLDNGHWVVQVDIKLGSDIFDIDDAWIEGKKFDIILAAPPCTHFALTGRSWFKQKDADGRTEADLRLVDKMIHTIEVAQRVNPHLVYAIEQPMTRLHNLRPWFKVQHVYRFHPHEFAGWLEGDDRVKESYRKQTWLFGSFRDPIKNEVEAVLGSYMHYRWGGSNRQRQEERSRTPYGFALAFYHSNGGR